MIPVYYWEGKNNLGEMIIPMIVSFVAQQESLWVPKESKGKYLIIGSEMPEKNFLQEGDIVWGYGNRYNKPVYPPKNVKFLAVRGKLTRNLIQGDVPEVYGDPGCLTSLVYNVPRTYEYDIGIITHWSEQNLFDHILDERILKISVLGNAHNIIDQIVKCKIIFSSSLHGCVVAESYGIPVVWFLGQKTKEEGFEIKFKDYFSGTGRNEEILPLKFKDYSYSEIARNENKFLPKPYLPMSELLKAWNDHWENKK